jgi:hypothetical protein
MRVLVTADLHYDIGRVNVVNVGSTYVAKRLLTMDI